ncbi:hypothetical protein ANN_12933 [Periplaneta americana]|uniref:Uncharacterized protein n=1 Tax=Periplaneta americana TaxID=6978 RepID=A0ABQ8TK38_PERAM|nr:hypothetical protein ANN_12933 [Periplaneta americana]
MHFWIRPYVLRVLPISKSGFNVPNYVREAAMNFPTVFIGARSHRNELARRPIPAFPACIYPVSKTGAISWKNTPWSTCGHHNRKFSFMKNAVYQRDRANNLEDLRQRITNAAALVTPQIPQNNWREVEYRRLDVYSVAQGTHIELH